ncbi:hypothetical protein DPMN_185588 [Dreissena polymorpha]|uniref:Uncharacterized protein n=1 Tax=Dreissena polymorpha TaxID=45954 RepID=A0A9D4I5Q1_DREPO|nr:hypothetical protein DPMN_185588 [Dreissena polymorpha]
MPTLTSTFGTKPEFRAGCDIDIRKKSRISGWGECRASSDIDIVQRANVEPALTSTFGKSPESRAETNVEPALASTFGKVQCIFFTSSADCAVVVAAALSYQSRFGDRMDATANVQKPRSDNNSCVTCPMGRIKCLLVVKAFKITKIVELREGGGGFAPLDPYQDYALHPPEVLAAPLDHQQNFEYPAPHPKPEIPDPPLWTGSKIPIFSDMIICRRSQNPFLPSCLRALSKSVPARLSGQAMYHFPHTD